MSDTQITIDVLQKVDGELGERLWSMYDAVFSETVEHCAERQSYRREEFIEVLSDESYFKLVAREEDTVVGLAVCTFDLEKVKLINPEFFWKTRECNGMLVDFRRRVLYVTAICVMGARKGRHVGAELMRKLHSVGLRNNALAVGYDYSRNINKDLPSMIAGVTGCTHVEREGSPDLDCQSYCLIADYTLPEFQQKVRTTRTERKRGTSNNRK